MFNFSQIEEVKLARGSHARPEFGLCFMEMAAWFAGEEHSDQPKCTCPVLGTYGVGLNDTMPTNIRDRLLKPVIPLIVGTTDWNCAWKRAKFLLIWVVNKVLPIALRADGNEGKALAYEAVRTFNQAKIVCQSYNVCPSNELSAEYTAFIVTILVDRAARKLANAELIWTVAVEGLRQAILIGRHDGFADPEPVIVERRAKLVELVSK